ncbi:MAG: AraC family transcriptional regulator [Flavobacterium sp.]|nr:MAG: AraC family transcriptional regulator [Flavobacterium sp.]
MVENVAQSIYDETVVDSNVFVLKFINETTENSFFKREVSSSFIQFHFCVKGSASFSFNNGNYRLPIMDETSLLLYNPQRDLPIEVSVSPRSWVVSLLLPINSFHALFSRDAEYISFLSDENKDRKYYKDMPITPSMAIILNQLLNFNLHPSVKPLYFKAKTYELLSLYFNRPANMDIEQCPFLVDEDNVMKIKRAKEIILKRMAEPPSLQQLADEVQLPINRLKEGFKQVYGDTVFGFLFDYKMEYARQLLASGSYNVNEVGLKVGYSTASHFIAAFKKKYGTTPKRFVMALTR